MLSQTVYYKQYYIVLTCLSLILIWISMVLYLSHPIFHIQENQNLKAFFHEHNMACMSTVD